MNHYSSVRSDVDLIDQASAEKKFLGENPKSIRGSEWCERMQLCDLFLSKLIHLSFPLRVEHNGTEFPDFFIKCPERTILVEASRIAAEPVERLVSLTRDTVASIDLSLVDRQRLSNDQLIQASAPGGEWSSGDWSKWQKRVRQIVAEKTRKLQKLALAQTDECWLLLLDKLWVDCRDFHAPRTPSETGFIRSVLSKSAARGWNKIIWQDCQNPPEPPIVCDF